MVTINAERMWPIYIHPCRHLMTTCPSLWRMGTQWAGCDSWIPSICVASAEMLWGDFRANPQQSAPPRQAVGGTGSLRLKQGLRQPALSPYGDIHHPLGP